MKSVIGLDIGTSGIKAILVNELGTVTKTYSESYDFDTIKDGWNEQNPKLWWESAIRTIKGIIKEEKKSDVLAISMSGQMHTTVLLDKIGKVIRPAILWNDTRTTKQCAFIQTLAGGKNELLEMVSNPALEGFSAGKLLWVKEHEYENFKKIDIVLMPKDYIGYKLTGIKYTEKSDASGTLLMDVKKGIWHDKLIKKLGIPKKILPQILNSSDVIGNLLPEIAEQVGLSVNCKVIAGGADNACAALGMGIINENDALISIGTSGTVIINVKDNMINVDGSYHLFSHCYQNDLYEMSVMLSSGLSLKWLKEQMLQTSKSYDELCKYALLAKPGSQGIYFLPYLCGERSPHPNAQATAAFLGIQSTTNQSEMIRSVLEGVGYGCRECLEVMDPLDTIKRIKITGGGARSDVWCQIISDIINREVESIDIIEGPAYGAALLAGMGCGLFKDLQTNLNTHAKIGKLYYPNLRNGDIYNHHYLVYKKLYKYLLPAYQEMKK